MDSLLGTDVKEPQYPSVVYPVMRTLYGAAALASRRLATRKLIEEVAASHVPTLRASVAGIEYASMLNVRLKSCVGMGPKTWRRVSREQQPEAATRGSRQRQQAEAAGGRGSKQQSQQARGGQQRQPAASSLTESTTSLTRPSVQHEAHRQFAEAVPDAALQVLMSPANRGCGIRSNER